MTRHNKGGAPDHKPLPVATFKNSLRSWQAQWKAQKEALATPARDEGKPPRREPA